MLTIWILMIFLYNWLHLKVLLALLPRNYPFRLSPKPQSLNKRHMDQCRIRRQLTGYNKYNPSTIPRSFTCNPTIVISSVIKSYVPYLKHNVGRIERSGEVGVLCRYRISITYSTATYTNKSFAFSIYVVNIILSGGWKVCCRPWQIHLASYLCCNFRDYNIQALCHILYVFYALCIWEKK